jgi:hypothetical protein
MHDLDLAEVAVLAHRGSESHGPTLGESVEALFVVEAAPRKRKLKFSPGLDEAFLSILAGKEANLEVSVTHLLSVGSQGVPQFLGLSVGFTESEKTEEKWEECSHAIILMPGEASVFPFANCSSWG